MIIKNTITGSNGDNETFIGNSKQISLSFYDENKQEIPIKNSKKNLEFLIHRDLSWSSSNTSQDYVFVNASQINLAEKNHFLPNAITLSGSNVSVHIQIKPIDPNTGYVVLMKFGQTPILNSTLQSFDYWKIFCPSGKV
jgi:hypothetical protein